QLLDRWSAQVPAELPGIGLDVVEASAAGGAASPTLVLCIASSEPLRSLDVFPEGPVGMTFGSPETSVAADRRSAEMRFPVAATGNSPPSLPGAPLTLTVVDGERFAERLVMVGAGDAAPASPTAAATWLAMLGTALL